MTTSSCKILLLSLLGFLVQAAAAQLPVLRVSFPGEMTADMTYIQGTMTLTDTDGSQVALPAKFKTRGATAKQYLMKPSFNMKIRTVDSVEIDTCLLGLRSASSWILDAMAIDRICMRNRVCFDLWNAYARLPYTTSFNGRNGTVGRFVEVYINDTYKGIYCLSDRINRKLLGLKKPKVADNGTVTIRGVLYKQGTTDVADQSTVGYFNDSTIYVIQYHDAWELQEPEDYPGATAWQRLNEAYASYNNYAKIKQTFDIDNLADYTLLIMALSIGDNWGNKNKFYSARNVTQADKSTVYCTPWDLDASLGGNYNGTNYDGTYSTWSPSDITKNTVEPFATCLAQPDFQALLKTKWQKLRSTPFAVDSVAKRLTDYRDLFLSSGAWARQTAYWDAQQYKPLYVSDLTKEINYIIQWYRDRHDTMDTYFGITPDRISAIRDTPSTPQVYTLDGRKAGKLSSLQRGIYIVNGRKVWIP